MKISTLSAIALLLAAFARPAAALEPNSVCQALDAWVSQLEKLPADYASFSALLPEQRRAVFGRLSDAESSALWQHQLSAALAAGGYSLEQRVLIAEAARFLTPEIYAGSRARGTADFPVIPVIQEARKSLEQRIARVFSRQEARDVFYQLGPPAGSGAGGLACNCSLESAGAAECTEGRVCRAPLCAERFGCGFGGTEWCDGVCRAF